MIPTLLCFDLIFGFGLFYPYSSGYFIGSGAIVCLPHCLLNRLSRCRSKKTSKLRVTDLCEGNSPMTGEFPAQRASDAKNVSIWWHHHENLRKHNKTMCMFCGIYFTSISWAHCKLGHHQYGNSRESIVFDFTLRVDGLVQERHNSSA